MQYASRIRWPVSLTDLPNSKSLRKLGSIASFGYSNVCKQGAFDGKKAWGRPPLRLAVVTVSDAGVPRPALTPPPGGWISFINLALDAGGWLASCGRAGNHLGEAEIREGVLDKTIYFGLLQFVLSTIPSAAKAVHAALQLTRAQRNMRRRQPVI
jgi:hypothetical protein